MSSLSNSNMSKIPYDQQLHLAALQGNLDQIRHVLDSGKVHVDCRDKERTTPLILSAANNHVWCVQELLKRGADPAARRMTGTCALFFASQGGYLDIVKLLLDAGAPADLPCFDGGTPLFVASQCNHTDVAEELLARGADIHSPMIDGAIPLFIAAQNGHLKMIEFLLSKGADVNLRRKDGASPLWIAAQMGHTGAVKLLLSYAAEVDCIREDGATPLFKACHKGHHDVVGVLLEYTPQLGLLQNGESALHAAALFGHLKICRMLTARGADLSLLNTDGKTAPALARESGYDLIADHLDRLAENYMRKPLTTSNSILDQNQTVITTS